MSSSSEDGNLAQLRAVAEGTDAALNIEANRGKKESSKRRAHAEGNGQEASCIGGPRLKLRRLLDDRIEHLLDGVFTPTEQYGAPAQVPREQQEGNEDSGALRLYRRVPRGAPVLLESQSSLMNEYSVPKQFPRIREKRGYHVKNPCLSAVVVDSEEVLKGAAEAAAAARPCVARPTASEESSEDLDARKVRQRKRITAALASRSGASALGDTDVGGAPSVKPFAEDAGAGGGSSKGTAGTQTGDAMPGKVASEKKKRKGKRERKRAAREKAAENGTK